VEVCKDEGAGLLLISHHKETVKRIADDIIQLRGQHGETGGVA
jgi:ABC-type glutathione transport system ATPase component